MTVPRRQMRLARRWGSEGACPCLKGLDRGGLLGTCPSHYPGRERSRKGTGAPSSRQESLGPWKRPREFLVQNEGGRRREWGGPGTPELCRPWRAFSGACVVLFMLTLAVVLGKRGVDGGRLTAGRPLGGSTRHVSGPTRSGGRRSGPG